ncbi:MAG: type II toxin-antitoxin system YafQ family toxin [Bacteroidales bacterium]|nr:type II toxin-antitoxin system YafQ family toxin [Bacteroidales bacterium]
MYSVEYTNQFKKDLKRCQKQGRNLRLIHTAISILREDGALPPEYKPHRLHGQYAGKWECHIQPDWLLIWEQYDNELRMIMTNTGTHSELFKK